MNPKICKQFAELLPWFLRGTLSTDEEQQVRIHLEDCEACQEELQRTRTAWSLAEGHLPAETLVDFAMEIPIPAAQRQLAESHLRHCPHCREELDVLRENHEGDADNLAARIDRQSFLGMGYIRPLVSSRRFQALAAVLAILVCGVGWWWNGWQLSKERTLRYHQLEELQAQIDTLSAPRLNIPLVELFPSAGREVVRSAEEFGEINTVSLPAEATQFVLNLLFGKDDPTQNLVIEISDNRGEVLWRGEGLVRNADGHFALTLPSNLLPHGRSTIRVVPLDGGKPIARYEVLTSLAEY